MDHNQSNNNSVTAGKPQQKRVIWMCLLAVLIALAGVFSFNEQARNLSVDYYNYVLKFEHFSKGDRVYVKGSLLGNKNSRSSALTLYRMIRPATTGDLDTMSLSDAAKRQVTAKLGAVSNSYLIECKTYIEVARLLNNKTAYIGRYIDWKIADYYASNGKVVKSIIAYAVAVDKKLTYSNNLYFMGCTTRVCMGR